MDTARHINAARNFIAQNEDTFREEVMNDMRNIQKVNDFNHPAVKMRVDMATAEKMFIFSNDNAKNFREMAMEAMLQMVKIDPDSGAPLFTLMDNEFEEQDFEAYMDRWALFRDIEVDDYFKTYVRFVNRVALTLMLRAQRGEYYLDESGEPITVDRLRANRSSSTKASQFSSSFPQATDEQRERYLNTWLTGTVSDLRAIHNEILGKGPRAEVTTTYGDDDFEKMEISTTYGDDSGLFDDDPIGEGEDEPISLFEEMRQKISVSVQPDEARKTFVVSMREVELTAQEFRQFHNLFSNYMTISQPEE